MKTTISRLIAVGSFFAILLSAFASSANADDATPVAPSVDASPTEVSTPAETPEAVVLLVAFYYCYGSDTPGTTDWLAFSYLDVASTSTCETDFDAVIDPAETVSIYDADTNELLQTITFTTPSGNSTVAPAGSFYLVESLNGTTSPIYTLAPGEVLNVNALAHIDTPFPNPGSTSPTTSYDIRSGICEPSDPSERGKLLVISERRALTNVSAADEITSVACDGHFRPDGIASIGAYYLEGAELTTAAEGSFGPFTDDLVVIDDLPTGNYLVRFVRNNGDVQVSDPFFVAGDESSLELFIYTGEELTPTATATATATNAGPTPTGTVTALPNTGAGSSNSSSMLLTLGGLFVLTFGATVAISRSARHRR